LKLRGAFMAEIVNFINSIYAYIIFAYYVFGALAFYEIWRKYSDERKD
jgi:hypothetical protein